MSDDKYLWKVGLVRDNSAHMKRVRSVSEKYGKNLGTEFRDRTLGNYFNLIVKPIARASTIEEVVQILCEQSPVYLEDLRKGLKASPAADRNRGQSKIESSVFEDINLLGFLEPLWIWNEKYGTFVQVKIDSTLEFPLLSGGIKALNNGSTALRRKATDFSLFTMHPYPRKQRRIFGTADFLEIPVVAIEAKASYIDATMADAIAMVFFRTTERADELLCSVKKAVLTETLTGLPGHTDEDFQKEYYMDKVVVLKEGPNRGAVNDNVWDDVSLKNLFFDFTEFADNEISKRFSEQDIIGELLGDYAQDS